MDFVWECFQDIQVKILIHFSSVTQSCLTVIPWTAACQASLFITNSWSLLKLMSTESVMPSNHLILCCPLLLQPSIFPSKRVFSKESVLDIRWLRQWSFSFSISPSNEYSGLISFSKSLGGLSPDAIIFLTGLFPSVSCFEGAVSLPPEKRKGLWSSSFPLLPISQPFCLFGVRIDLLHFGSHPPKPNVLACVQIYFNCQKHFSFFFISIIYLTLLQK